MKFIDWVRSKLIGNKTIEISSDDLESYYRNLETKFNITENALFTAVDLIARSLAKCEFVTVQNNKEFHGSEYYLWNYSPNKNQTKVEFFIEAVSKLIFNGELLIFETANGQLLIADGFSKKEYAVIDNVFSNITTKNFTFQRTFNSSEVIHLVYSNSNIVMLLNSMCQLFEELINSASDRYNKAVGHKGILEIKAMAVNDTKFQERFKELMNKRFVEYFKAKNAVLPLFEGFSYSEPSTDSHKSTNSEVNDVQKLRDEVYSAVGNAFHIPPAIISGTASQLSDATDAFIANAIDPLAQLFEQGITRARYGEEEFLKGNYLLVDTTTVRHIDAISSANNIDKAIACSVLSPEKAQKYCNMLPNAEKWAKSHYMTKNYQTADMAVKGGEKE